MNNQSPESPENPQIDNKVVPAMREAITMIQMVLFKLIQEDIDSRTQDLTENDQRRLAGAVVNNLFGTEPADAGISNFASENRELVEEELRNISERFPKLCPFLTDALRMKAICDNQEGIHSIPSLLMAKALGILLEDRAFPMPSTFMISIRTLAAQHGLVEPLQAAPPAE